MKWHSLAWAIGDGTILVLLLAELWSLRRETRRDRRDQTGTPPD